MKKRIMLFKDWKDASGTNHAAKSILKVDEDTFKTLTTGDDIIARLYTEEIEKAEKEEREAEEARLAEVAAKALAKALEGTQAQDPHLRISIHEKSDDDPFWGYGPNKEKKELTKQDACLASGLFLNDVYKAGGTNATGFNPSQETETLSKIRIKGEEEMKRRTKFISEKSGNTITSVGQDSGYMAPPGTSMALFMAQVERSQILSQVMGIPMDTQSLELPKLVDYDRSNDLIYGGIMTSFVGEEGSFDPSKYKTEAIKLVLHKLTAYGVVTHEASKWSPIATGAFLFQRFAGGMVWKKEDRLLHGTGVGQPLGVLHGNNKALLLITRTADNDIQFDDVLNMDSRFVDTGNGNSINWITNRQNKPKLCKLKDAAGNAIWLSGGNFPSAVGRAPATLEGTPVTYNSKIKKTASSTPKDIALINWNEYVLGTDATGPETAASQHFFFDTAKEAFRVIEYLDGRPTHTQTTTPEEGDAVSPYVALSTN